MSLWKKIANEAGNILLNNISNDNRSQNDVTNDIMDSVKGFVMDAQVVESSEYTSLGIFDANVKFKTAVPTSYWNCRYNFGAAEIDTIFIYSESGEEPYDYERMLNEPGYFIPGITFSTNVLNPKEPTLVKQKLNRLYGFTDVDISKSSNSMFMYKIKGENSRYYFESNYMEYEGYLDGEPSHIYYEVYLALDKSRLSSSQLQAAIGEYHTIINTMEFVR